MPELAADTGSGARLRGYKAGEWPDEIIYQVEGALVRLVAGYDHGEGLVLEHVMLL